MKSKTLKKKLSLNKKTVADLTTSNMKNAYGGGPGSVQLTCVTCVYTGPCVATTVCCPSVCTCGTGDPLCPCGSVKE